MRCDESGAMEHVGCGAAEPPACFSLIGLLFALDEDGKAASRFCKVFGR